MEKEILIAGKVRIHYLHYTLLMAVAIMLSDIEYWGFDVELWGMDCYVLMSLSFALGWLICFFLPIKGVLPSLKVFTFAAALALCGILFSPGDALFIFSMFFFQVVTGVLVAYGFYVFAFILTNQERFCTMALAALYYGITGLTWHIGTMDEIYKSYGAAFLLALLIWCVMKVRPEDLILEKERTSDAERFGKYIVLFLFVLYFTLDFLFSIYSADWPDEMFTPYNAALLAAILLVYPILMKLQRGIWHAWNVFLVLSIVGIALVMLGREVISYAGAFVFGVGIHIGYIGVMYIVGGFGKRSRSVSFFKGYCLVSFFLDSISPFCFNRIYDIVLENYDIFSLGFAFFCLVLCVLLTPALFKYLFQSSWVNEYRDMDMTIIKEKVERTDQFEGYRLTPREKEICVFLLKGFTLRQVAGHLGISFSTVNTHCKSLYKKLSINSRVELFVRFGTQE